jgi:putative oxidoreductase
MHVLIGPGHHALKRSMAQAALAALLIAATPAAGVQWIAWLLVGCSVLIGTAALLVVWPGEHAGGFSQEISMQSQVATLEAERSSTSSDALRLLVLPGRALYALIFLIGALNNFSHQAVGYAARQGVPLPGVLVPLAGVIAIAGGLSVLLGYHARFGAALLVLFLVPVTLTMHRFWAVSDPTMAMLEQTQFLKNVSMLGGALLIAYFGAGPMSLDTWRHGRRPIGLGLTPPHTAHSRSAA